MYTQSILLVPAVHAHGGQVFTPSAGRRTKEGGKNRADEGAGEAKFGSDIAAATRGLFAEPGRQGSTRVPPREGFLQETASGFPPRCRQRQTLHCLW